MTIITQKYYQIDPILPSQDEVFKALRAKYPQEEPVDDYYPEDPLFDDHRLWTLHYHYDKTTLLIGQQIVEKQKDFIVTTLQEVQEELPELTNWKDIITTIQQTKPTVVSQDFPQVTPLQEELCGLLDEYAMLVRTSHMIAGHGKSWEPYISTTSSNGHIVEVELISYQGGDRVIITASSEQKLVDKVRDHIETVKPLLSKGTTNSNPLVMMMMDEVDPDDFWVKYQGLSDYDDGKPYSKMVIKNGVFLNTAHDWTIVCAGYPSEDESIPYVDNSELNYPYAVDALNMMQ